MKFNKVLLGGNLTRDPELRHSQSGVVYVNFGMAINETRISNGEKKETTVFVDLVAFGTTAETIHKYLKKGDPIFVDGKLNFSTWEVGAHGDKRSKLSVIVNTFQFIGSKKDDSAPAPSEVPF